MGGADDNAPAAHEGGRGVVAGVDDWGPTWSSQSQGGPTTGTLTSWDVCEVAPVCSRRGRPRPPRYLAVHASAARHLPELENRLLELVPRLLPS